MVLKYKTLTSVERMLPTLFTRCVASQSSEVRVGCSVFFAVRVFRIQKTRTPADAVAVFVAVEATPSVSFCWQVVQ